MRVLFRAALSFVVLGMLGAFMIGGTMLAGDGAQSLMGAAIIAQAIFMLFGVTFMVLVETYLHDIRKRA